MEQSYFTAPRFTFRLRPCSLPTALFLFVFLLNFTIGFGQGVTISSNGDEGPVFTQQQTIPLSFEFDEPINGFDVTDIGVNNGSLSEFFVGTPDFEWLSSYDVDDFPVNFQDVTNIEAKTDRVIISVATNSIGEIFVLTFGNGIIKYDLNGNRSIFNNGDDLESPLDIAFNSEDYLYVADNGQARQIKVYSPQGNFLPNRTMGNGNAGDSENDFYGPVGLAFDSEDNLYVTDAYNGSSQDEFERYSVKIYYSDGNYVRFIGNDGYKFDNPYRIGVDANFNIYVSDSGGNNGRVLIFDSNFHFVDKIEGPNDNLMSPGSIVIDNDSGLIYIADLGEEINIGQFLLAQQNPEDLLNVFPDIVDGIENNEYDIKVFDQFRNYITSISNNINLPVDLTLDTCGKLIVLNAYFQGEINEVLGIPIPDIELDFDLEFYNRLPNSFTANLKIEQECLASEVSVNANVGEDAECNNTPASRDTFTATWDQTKPELITDCAGKDQTVQSGFIIPDYTDSGEVSFNDNCGVENLKYSQTPDVGETITQNTTVRITATDQAGNVSEVCSFELVLETANTAPTAVDDVYAVDQDAILNESTPGVLENDTDAEADNLTASIVSTVSNGTLTLNSDGSFIYEPNTGYFGPDSFTYIANDGTDDSEVATVTITVNSTNPNAPEIDCVNHELFLDENGQAILNPGDLFVGEPGNLIISADKVNFDCTNLGANEVIITATDPETGLSSTCPASVLIIDDKAPVANCASGYIVYLDTNGNATLAPEDLDNNSTDNCGIDSMALSQINFTRADLGEVPITLTVRDEAGNMDSCETTVEVVERASGNFECRENIVVYLDENGATGLSLEGLYTGDASGINLDASRLNFNCNDLGEVSVQLDYSGEQTGSCSISVEVRDEVAPEIITDVVELNLDTEGFAYLKENDVLVQDNCSREFVYRFGKSVFSCEDVGSNTINVEVEDINGNITNKNIEVRVNGEACKTPDDLKYLFIYPNPNNGIFTIVTPKDMFVEKVLVFDSRGRYILQQDYTARGRFYRMSIEAVAESVYTLQIFTNEGVIVKRVIVSR